jgi:hypothetical protein
MFKGRFTRIKDLSERRRLPRLGKIRLGVKMISDRTHKEYPKETEFFIVPPEVSKVYGDRPTSLEVMVPINDPEAVFPQAYKWYGGQRGLKCIGDGGVALRLKEETQAMEEIPCPCEHLETGECQKRGHFMVILPRINMGGVYQIDVGSYHSIVDINSGLEYVQALVGRFAMVPLRLCRAPKETHFGGQKQIHYTLQLFLDADVDTLNALREDTSRVLLSTRSLALPPPEDVDENGVIIEDEGEEGVKMAKETKEEVKTREPIFSSSGEPIGIDRERVQFPSKAPELPFPKEPKGKLSEGNEDGPRITTQQIEAIKRIAAKRGVTLNFDFLSGISYNTASRVIRAMQKEDYDLDGLYGELRGAL